MVRKIVSWFLYGLSATLAVLTVFGPHGLVQLSSLTREERALARKERELSLAVEKSKLALSEVESSPLELERRARNDFGLSREEEILYVEKK